MVFPAAPLPSFCLCLPLFYFWLAFFCLHLLLLLPFVCALLGSTSSLLSFCLCLLLLLSFLFVPSFCFCALSFLFAPCSLGVRALSFLFCFIASLFAWILVGCLLFLGLAAPSGLCNTFAFCYVWCAFSAFCFASFVPFVFHLGCFTWSFSPFAF